MTHKVTGLKYFCKTTRLNELETYKGSGLYWKRHLRKHGRDVEVGLLGTYWSMDRCIAAAKKFSEENDIVNSDQWANCIFENGLDGQPSGKAHVMFGKPSPCIGQKRPQTSAKLIGPLNPMYGKPGACLGMVRPKGKDSPLYGRKRPEGGGKKPHPVIGIKDGKEYHYASVADAARANNLNRSTIHRCCTGKTKSGGGFVWKYKE